VSWRNSRLLNPLRPLYRRIRRWRHWVAPDDYVRATHYFGDGWALNFLHVVDSDSLRRDFAQIKADGFNTVIIVVPWRGFQIDHYSPEYDPFYVEQLHRVMAAAQNARLAVIVRISYAHQILDVQPLSGLTMMQRLLTDPDTQAAWLDYCETVYRICAGYGCFRQCFLSWEEFWHAFWRWQLYKPEFRGELADEIGFSKYLNEQRIEGISGIPRPEEPEYDVFHGFVNHRIRQMHALASSRVPGLGIEIRVDKDRHVTADESVAWLNNDNFGDLPVTRYTYWAPFMGAENRGEILSSEQALHLLEHALGEWTDDGEHPSHIIDQFNFVDDAPKFRGVHARIAESDIGDFLSAAVPLLRQRSQGFGIWAYRDYRQNLLFNPRFLNGLAGWRCARGRAVSSRHGGVALSGGAVLRQFLPAQISGLQRAVTFDSLTVAVRLSRPLGSSSALWVRFNAGEWLSVGEEVDGEYLLEVPVKRPMIIEDGIVLEIKQGGAKVLLDRMFLYHVVFRGGFRRENGEPSEHYAHVVAFNRALEQFKPMLAEKQD
jgi:hypothetical protein